MDDRLTHHRNCVKPVQYCSSSHSANLISLNLVRMWLTIQVGSDGQQLLKFELPQVSQSVALDMRTKFRFYSNCGLCTEHPATLLRRTAPFPFPNRAGRPGFSQGSKSPSAVGSAPVRQPLPPLCVPPQPLAATVPEAQHRPAAEEEVPPSASGSNAGSGSPAQVSSVSTFQ